MLFLYDNYFPVILCNIATKVVEKGLIIPKIY